MAKQIKRIKGADMGSLKIGESAKLLLEDGRIALTSPVISYFNANSYLRVETKNSVYSTTGY